MCNDRITRKDCSQFRLDPKVTSISCHALVEDQFGQLGLLRDIVEVLAGLKVGHFAVRFGEDSIIELYHFRTTAQK